MKLPTKSTIIKNRVRVLYRPRAGRAKTKTCILTETGNLQINGGTHTVSQGAMFQWKGKYPWVIVNQGVVAARNLAGDGPDALSPEFLNEAVSNHYASDVLSTMNDWGKKHQSELVLIIMLGFSLILHFVFGIWAISKIGSLNDLIKLLLDHATNNPVSPSPAGIHDGTVTHA